MSDMSAGAIVPRVWLVTGDKPGDNAQVEIIARRLGWPFEIKRMLPRPEYVLGKPRFEVSLSHLDLDRSDKLAAPWPDLIITIGRRPSMAALWIRAQNNDRSKVVLLGPPKGLRDRFDLVIVSAQYRMPAGPNVLRLDLPLMRCREDTVKAAAGAWRGKLVGLPRPLTAVFVGGRTGPFRFDEPAALELIRRARAAAGPGHLYISTSRRTPREIADYLEKHLPGNATLFRWSEDAEDNPYLALLALADQIVVTGDSVSMLVETARLGRPLAIFPLARKQRGPERLRQLLARVPHGELLCKVGVLRRERDLSEIHRFLYRHRLAVPLGKEWIREGRKPGDELEMTVERVRKIVFPFPGAG